jgi:membrane associated rhomboid family serine protease
VPHRPLADIARATAVASIVSGAPSTVHAVITRRNLLASTRAAGTLMPGRRDRPGVIAGAVVHVGVSAFWGLVLGHTLPGRRTAAWGALGGLAIAAISLPAGARSRPALAALPQAPQWADNVAFGLVTGWLLSRSDASPS